MCNVCMRMSTGKYIKRLLIIFHPGHVYYPKYRLSSIICDVASFRLFKPVRSEPLHENNRKFLHIPFAK